MGRRISHTRTNAKHLASFTSGAYSPRHRSLALCVLFSLAIVLIAGAQAAAQQAPSPSNTNGRPESSVVRHVTIDWAKVEGATGYRILVRPLGGDVKFDEHSTATSMVLTLQPGTYQVRVISLNLFHQPASVSPWHNIDVVRVYKPVVKLLSPKVLYSGLGDVRETVDGLHFLPETTVALLRHGRVVATATIDGVRDNQLTLHFDLKKVAPGKYDLRVENPEHLSSVMPNAIEVRPRIQPNIETISLHSGYNDRSYRDVTVGGTGFVDGTGFFLDHNGHRIEVPNVTIHSSKQASVDLNLGSAAPGAYDLVAANPGGKVGRLKAAVEVVNITKPVFESMSPRSFTIGETTGAFTLRAKDLIPGTQVFLSSGGLLYPTVSLESQTSSSGTTETRRLQLDLTSTPPGKYDLVVANSQLLRTIVSGAVTVKPKPIPRLTGSSVTNAYDTLEYKGIDLNGVNLKSSFGVVLKRGEVAHDLTSKFVSPSRISVDIDFRGMSPGTYQVLIESSGRVVASLPGGISVRTPRQRFIHPTAPLVMIGYPYGLVLSPSFANSVSLSAIGGRFISDFPFGARFFPKVPGIRDMGIGVQAGYSLYDHAATGAVSGTTSTIGMSRPGINLYYRTPFNFPLNGFVTTGYGMSVSMFHSTSSTATLSGTSLDFYYRLGVGAELDLGKWIVFQTGVDWVRVLYSVTNLDVVELYLRGGVRFGK